MSARCGLSGGRVRAGGGGGGGLCRMVSAMGRRRDIVVTRLLARRLVLALSFVCGSLCTFRGVVSRVGGACGAHPSSPSQCGDFGLELGALDVSGLELRSYHALEASRFGALFVSDSARRVGEILDE